MKKGTRHKLANGSMTCKCTCAIFWRVTFSWVVKRMKNIQANSLSSTLVHICLFMCPILGSEFPYKHDT